MEMQMVRGLLCVVAIAGTAAAIQTGAAQAACPGNADALSTERVLVVDPAMYPRVGRQHFPQTLPLKPKEVVLTFDDGPEPASTGRVLDALKRECVRASFFVLGRSAAAHPALVRRALQEGHTVAHHSFAHPLLNHMPVDAAEAEINHGFAAVDAALYGKAERSPVTPFFRFPGFASNQALLERLDSTHGGILLFHDTKLQTAAMVPEFLRALKGRGYSVVHVTPPARPSTAAAN